MKIKLWKPIITKKFCIVYDVFGLKGNSSYQPIVIYEDQDKDVFYYLIAKPLENNMLDNQDNNHFHNSSEVYVRYTLANNKIKNYVVDCSQLFRIKRSVLLDNIDEVNNDLMPNINEYYIEQISKALYKCMKQLPPFISLLDISFNQQNNSLMIYSVYIHDDILNKYCLDNQGNELVDKNIYRSVPSIQSNYWNNRYNEGINLCREFLQGFFKDNIDMFNNEEKEQYKLWIIKDKADYLAKENNFVCTEPKLDNKQMNSN